MAEKLYVVIPSAGRPTLLQQTLASLTSCHKPGIYVKTIVVENGPQMGAEVIVNQFESVEKIEYIHVPMANKSHALNQALHQAKGGLVFFSDDDVRFDPQILTVYAKAAEGISSGQFYGGTCYSDYEEQPPQWLVPLFPRSARGFDLFNSKYKDGTFFLGFNWAAFADDIQKVGGFNTMLGPGSPIGTTVGDETDVQHRLRTANIQAIPLPEAIVWHYVPKQRSSLKWALKRLYVHGFTKGVRMESQNEVLGVPVSTFLSLLKHFALLCLRAVTFNSKQAISELRYTVLRIGQLIGYWQREQAIARYSNAFRQFPH